MDSVFVDKTATNSGEQKMVGVYISKTDADRLAMLSLKEGAPRTAILRQILGDYLDGKPSLSEMIEQAANKASTHWNQDIAPVTRSAGFAMTKKGYLVSIKNDLKTNRIDPEIIDQIMKGINI